MLNIKLLTASALVSLLSACGGGGDGGTQITSCVALPSSVGYLPPGAAVPVACTTSTATTSNYYNCCFTNTYSYSPGAGYSGGIVYRACNSGEKPNSHC